MNTHPESLNRYLSFSLGKEAYAVPLLDVKEVIAIPEITPIPHTPPHFLGLMNLRGQVISVVDLRKKLSIKPDPAAESAIIICDLGVLSIGVVVDSINSVLSCEATKISPAPEMQAGKATDYIHGIFRNGDELVILIEIAKAIGIEEITALKTNAAA
jgi:purine-binding chemotaxis protein CheW